MAYDGGGGVDIFHQIKQKRPKRYNATVLGQVP